jgi:hypothetical protein
MIALIYYGMGDKDMTLDWLNKETNYFMLLFGPMRPLWTDQDFAHIYEFLDQDPI